MAADMEGRLNRQWRIARWPKGLSSDADFQWTESPAPRPGPGQVLVQNKFLSLDPTNRVWLWERDSYLPQQQLGDVMRGIGVGRVVEANNAALAVGTPVYGVFGWQDYALVGPNDLVLPLSDDPNIPLTMQLGLFGHIGLTAYIGLFDIARIGAGETLVVSGAAGAVGSLVGQIGKIMGCRVIGVAGTDEKCRWITDELGFDAAINYRTEKPLLKALTREIREGIDVYWENVGGETLEAVLQLMKLRGRVVMCGGIAAYNESDSNAHGSHCVRNIAEIVIKRVRLEGFVCLDYLDRAGEAFGALSKWHQEGKLNYRVHVVNGLQHAPEAMNMLFDGRNNGKLIIEV